MTRRDDLDGVLRDLERVLGDADQASMGRWVLSRREILGSPTVSADHRDSVIRELHDAVLSDGGLLDLWVEPTPESGVTPEQARSGLAGLAYRLYQLTDPRSTLVPR